MLAEASSSDIGDPGVGRECGLYGLSFTKVNCCPFNSELIVRFIFIKQRVSFDITKQNGPEALV